MALTPEQQAAAEAAAAAQMASDQAAADAAAAQKRADEQAAAGGAGAPAKPPSKAPTAGVGKKVSATELEAEAHVPSSDGKRPVVWLQSGHPVHRAADLIMVSEDHAERLEKAGRARLARNYDVVGLSAADVPFYEEP